MTTMLIVTCPHCRTMLDGYEHVGPSDVTPTPDESATVCAGCGGVAVFTLSPVGALILRLPTDAELDELRTMPELAAAQDAVVKHSDYVDAVAAARLAVRKT